MGNEVEAQILHEGANRCRCTNERKGGLCNRWLITVKRSGIQVKCPDCKKEILFVCNTTKLLSFDSENVKYEKV